MCQCVCVLSTPFSRLNLVGKLELTIMHISVAVDQDI